jgi:hypothetical protein
MSIKKQSNTATRQKYNKAIQQASEMMEMGIEPRSALRQAGSDVGIPYGDEMGKFVNS